MYQRLRNYSGRGIGKVAEQLFHSYTLEIIKQPLKQNGKHTISSESAVMLFILVRDSYPPSFILALRRCATCITITAVIECLSKDNTRVAGRARPVLASIVKDVN